jgi:phospho-N-acetylmuramoyl-pentapeptide-transferase
VGAILATPVLMRYCESRRIGQHIREDGPASHSVKAGTPTMGGMAIVCAVVIGYAIGHIGTEIRFSRTGYLAIGAVVRSASSGSWTTGSRSGTKRSLGLNKRGKSGRRSPARWSSPSWRCTGPTPRRRCRSPAST